MTKTFFFLSMVLCRASGVFLTRGEKQEVLSYHNELRRGEGASNMKEMKWDHSLALAASVWADRCIWGHGQPEGITTNFGKVGQNLYFTTGPLLNVTVAIKSFFNEKAYYDINNLFCTRVCGHYTQIVWADSEYLGCAVASCATNKLRGTIMVCNYGPSGNFRGKRPFKSGLACSECEPEYRCRDGLCHSP